MTDEDEQRQSHLQHWRKLAAEQEKTLLFETAGENHSGNSYLFQRPLRSLTANSETSLASLFAELAVALDAGYYVAGLLRYEAGYIFERVRNRSPAEEPLAWFGIYQEPEIVTPSSNRTSPLTKPQTSSLLPDPLCLSMKTPLLEYLERVATIKRYIEAGDTYQVNLTTTLRSSYRGEVLTLYNVLAEQQPAPFSALLHLPNDEFVLSFSPELFFSIDANRTITVRPMKGTASLGRLPEEDRRQVEWLAADEKNRAEHLMIVDLLRSDVGRLCIPGSLRVDPLFAVERYRTLLQMTSTISGLLRETASLEDIFRALFPSGSMTGAPKPRTMEILSDLEREPRGVYSGAIGFAAPSGAAVFNVAIRTVVLKEGSLRMGVGGGIVADSIAEQEHAECWLKGKFLHRASPPFGLVETLLWSGSFPRLDAHLDRLAASADQLHFSLDRDYVRQQLMIAVSGRSEPCRVRLVLERDGRVSLTTGEVKTWSSPMLLRLSSKPTWSRESFLRHKTTFRPLYESEFRAAQQLGFHESIFINERNELTEGSISNLLVLIDDVWLTPASACGVLPGVARSELLHRGKIQETVLTLADLTRADAVALCNAVRGIGAVNSVQLQDGTVLHFGAALDLPKLQ